MSDRFARQVSLREIGTTGQARIGESIARAGHGDARAMAVALDYLERAGGRVHEAGVAVDVPDGAALERLAGRPELLEAAAFLMGSLAATARLGQVVGVESRVADVPPLSEP